MKKVGNKTMKKLGKEAQKYHDLYNGLVEVSTKLASELAHQKSISSLEKLAWEANKKSLQETIQALRDIIEDQEQELKHPIWNKFKKTCLHIYVTIHPYLPRYI